MKLTSKSKEFQYWTFLNKFVDMDVKQMLESKSEIESDNKLFTEITDAIINHVADSRNKDFWKEIYRFRAKFYMPDSSNTFWDNVLDYAKKILKDFNTDLAVSVIVSIECELEDFCKAQENIITRQQYDEMYGSLRS